MFLIEISILKLSPNVGLGCTRKTQDIHLMLHHAKFYSWDSLLCLSWSQIYEPWAKFNKNVARQCWCVSTRETEYRNLTQNHHFHFNFRLTLFSKTQRLGIKINFKKLHNSKEALWMMVCRKQLWWNVLLLSQGQPSLWLSERSH